MVKPVIPSFGYAYSTAVVGNTVGGLPVGSAGEPSSSVYNVQRFSPGGGRMLLPPTAFPFQLSPQTLTAFTPRVAVPVPVPVYYPVAVQPPQPVTVAYVPVIKSPPAVDSLSLSREGVSRLSEQQATNGFTTPDAQSPNSPSDPFTAPSTSAVQEAGATTISESSISTVLSPAPPVKDTALPTKTAEKSVAETASAEKSFARKVGDAVAECLEEHPDIAAAIEQNPTYRYHLIEFLKNPEWYFNTLKKAYQKSPLRRYMGGAYVDRLIRKLPDEWEPLIYEMLAWLEQPVSAQPA